MTREQKDAICRAAGMEPLGYGPHVYHAIACGEQHGIPARPDVTLQIERARKAVRDATR